MRSAIAIKERTTMTNDAKKTHGEGAEARPELSTPVVRFYLNVATADSVVSRPGLEPGPPD